MPVSVVAHLAAAHYSEHLPFYRLEQPLARTGVTLARSTQVALRTQLDALVAPLVAHLKTAVLASGYVHLDATPVDVCDPARPGRAREATLWAYRARSADPAVEGLVWFEYQASKSPAHPRAVLADYRGVLQTDGAAGLDTLGAPNEVTHLACWAHARRRFIQALRLGESRAGPYRAPYLAQLDRLFRLDARARRIAQAHPAAAARVATWRARFEARERAHPSPTPSLPAPPPTGSRCPRRARSGRPSATSSRSALRWTGASRRPGRGSTTTPSSTPSGRSS